MRGVTGGDLPAHIWRDFMREALAEPGANPLVGAQATPQSCNVRACSRSYRSFRPSDCTYQPYSGERRLCEK
jgi:membrane peptidoglycan carboxypeptidase